MQRTFPPRRTSNHKCRLWGGREPRDEGNSCLIPVCPRPLLLLGVMTVRVFPVPQAPRAPTQQRAGGMGAVQTQLPDHLPAPAPRSAARVLPPSLPSVPGPQSLRGVPRQDSPRWVLLVTGDAVSVLLGALAPIPLPLGLTRALSGETWAWRSFSLLPSVPAASVRFQVPPPQSPSTACLPRPWLQTAPSRLLSPRLAV